MQTSSFRNVSITKFTFWWRRLALTFCCVLFMWSNSKQVVELCIEIIILYYHSPSTKSVFWNNLGQSVTKIEQYCYVYYIETFHKLCTMFVSTLLKIKANSHVTGSTIMSVCPHGWPRAIQYKLIFTQYHTIQ